MSEHEPPVGSVIAYRVRLGDRDYDYVSLRAGNGLWYTTGGDTLQGASWNTLVTALRSQGVGAYSLAVGWDVRGLAS